VKTKANLCRICGKREARLCVLCHGMKSKNRKQAFKIKMLKERGYKCERCGIEDNKVLALHHIGNAQNNNRYNPKAVVVLCANCHTKIHGMGARSD